MLDAFDKVLEVGDEVISLWIDCSKIRKKKCTITRMTAKRVALDGGWSDNVPHNLIKIKGLEKS